MKDELYKKLKGEEALVRDEGEMAIIKSPTLRPFLLWKLSTNKILI